MNKLDLADYYKRFPAALKKKYEDTFDAGFKNIRDLYKREVMSDGGELTVDHVMAIFDGALPFVRDWTKPDRKDLAANMEKGKVATLIKRLPAAGQDLQWLTEIWCCFRELSLTALVLHHVYPKRFAMCSHHLASVLYIAGRKTSTVPEYYLEYCRELARWGKRFNLTVVETQYALWTWYRLAQYGSREQQKQNSRTFYRDPWVKERRAKRIAESLNVRGKLDFARFFLDTDPTLAAIIAWRQFEIAARDFLRTRDEKVTEDLNMPDIIAKLPPGRSAPWESVWERRNHVMHDGWRIPKEEAEKALQGVVEFIEDHMPEFLSE